MSTYVSDQIDSRQLLHKLPHYAQHGPVEELLLAVLQERLVRASVSGLTLLVDGVLDLDHLLVRYVLVRLGLKVKKDGACLIVAILGNELIVACQYFIRRLLAMDVCYSPIEGTPARRQ